MDEKARVNNVIRITFGFVHSILITLVGFGLALLYPSLTTLLFGLVGFIVMPLLSFIFGWLCNLCVLYVTTQTYSFREAFRTAWLPSLGVFCISLMVMPLEYTQISLLQDINLMFGLSLIGNGLVTAFLQIYASRLLSQSEGSSAPT